MKMQVRHVITGGSFRLSSQRSLLLSWFILLFFLAALNPHQVFTLIPGHWVPPGVDITALKSEISYQGGVISEVLSPGRTLSAYTPIIISPFSAQGSGSLSGGQECRPGRGSATALGPLRSSAGSSRSHAFTSFP